MKILVTGFDPFGGQTINPAYEVVKGLPDTLGQAQVIKLEIPTVFNRSFEVIKEAVALHDPEVIICLGQAGGSDQIRLEKVAINLNEARIPDNQCNQPLGETIVDGGPDGLFTNLPVKKLLSALNRHDIPGVISYTAGTYVCNHVMYLTRYHYPDKVTGFIHIPLLPSQGQPSMSLERMTQGVHLMLMALFEEGNNQEVVAGQLD